MSDGQHTYLLLLFLASVTAVCLALLRFSNGFSKTVLRLLAGVAGASGFVTLVLGYSSVTGTEMKGFMKSYGQAAGSASGSQAKPVWPGWAGIDHLFTFGDSYSSTNFDVRGVQPSPENPMGNPPYPGVTATNGPNWVAFLTNTYNQSFVKNANFAFGGATVDSSLIASYSPYILSLKDQIQKEYLPIYAPHPPYFNWKPSSTLFAMFVGVNDVGNLFLEPDNALTFVRVFEEYAKLMDQLYHTGARNFLFLNVPPMNRSPLTISMGGLAQTQEAEVVAMYNSRLSDLAANLSSTYRDATTFVFDTNALYTQVLNDPCSHPETCPIKNLTDFCVDYESGTKNWYTYSPNCQVPVDEYFWLNILHPTFRIMNVTAQEVARQLS